MARRYKRLLPNQVGRKVTVVRDLDHDTVTVEYTNGDSMPRVEPKGDPSDLKRARAILSTGNLSETQITRQILYAISALLAPMSRPSSSRLSDEVKRLTEISEVASSLAAKVQSLSDEGRLELGRQLPPGSFTERISGSFLGDTRCWSIIIDLLDLDACAESAIVALHARYGEDKGGGVSKAMDDLHYGNPTELFIERVMGLYERAFGISSVTKTVPKIPGTGRSCYAVADALHMYVLGVPLGHRNRFIEMVSARNDQSRRRGLS